MMIRYPSKMIALKLWIMKTRFFIYILKEAKKFSRIAKTIYSYTRIVWLLKEQLITQTEKIMKLQSLILFLFLLIPCTGISQDGLTADEHFWFTEAQVREMYKVKLENEFLDSENISLSRMIVFCDSVSAANERSKEQLQIQIGLKDQTIKNHKLIIEQEQGKFAVAEETIQSINRKKNFYITTTTVAVTLTLLVLVLK